VDTLLFSVRDKITLTKVAIFVNLYYHTKRRKNVKDVTTVAINPKAQRTYLKT
jgi:hypothetical protein